MSDRFHCYCPCGSCEDFSHCYRGECDAPKPNLEVAIAEAVANFIAGDDREWVDEYEPAQRDEFVASIPRLLAALKAARIAVVELPERSRHIRGSEQRVIRGHLHGTGRGNPRRTQGARPVDLHHRRAGPMTDIDRITEVLTAHRWSPAKKDMRGGCYGCAYHGDYAGWVAHITPAIEAELHPVIETTSQLDALADGTVILDADDDVARLDCTEGVRRWRWAGIDTPHYEPSLPARVLWTPGADQ